MCEAIELYKKILSGELKRFPNKYWNNSKSLENAAMVTRYLIEEVLKWDEEKVKKDLNEKVFRENKLSGMLECTFGRIPFKAIDNAYPGKYFKNDINKKEVDVDREDTERKLNIVFNKNGKGANKTSNGMSTKLVIPIKWIKKLGITEEERAVRVKLENEKIIIEKYKND